MTPLRILICGGRNYTGPAIDNWLNMRVARHGKESIEMVIHGGALGADALAAAWCSQNVVPCALFRAPWEGAGRAGGPVRNAWMIDMMKPTLVLAAPGGRGTANMVALAHNREVPVELVE